VTTGAVGVAGILAPTLTAWRQRVHERTLARAERMFGTRSETYAEIGRYLRRERLYVERTLPVLGPIPDPPERLDDEEWARILGRVAVHASKETLAALEEVRDRVQKFGAAALTHRLLEPQAGRRPELANQLFEVRETANAARERAYAAIDEAERIMREELASL
jgi:hypothetical protein